MFVLCGYNFCGDGNALDPVPVLADSYSSITVKNGIFDHWNLTNDVSSDYSSEIPSEWDVLTVMDANFNGTLEAGNIDESLADADGFKVKRRKTDEYNWITLAYFDSAESSLSFALNDNIAQSGIEYEYALVPVFDSEEGEYLTETITTKFEGVFICDMDTIYRFYTGVSYGAETRVQKIGTIEAYGRQYPIIVSNGAINYNAGSVSGYVMSPDYDDDYNWDRLAMVETRKELKDFLVNKKAKILKDWNGNIWLMMITSNPSTSYVSDFGMGIGKVSVSWTEIGDSNTQEDLYQSGIITEAE